ncbi:hypothetical protein ROJ8625_00235 [Roseivivax jejudonensis]|uniref:Uncharacterized protein n=1 Tax=Roseivivax jejudonensis TaxID=1529041 RepID=A0A1X6Y5J1_9RHOB|nr:hypothetical protein ROJ8625_00235 [Roseivivax jejudonensis]
MRCSDRAPFKQASVGSFESGRVSTSRNALILVGIVVVVGVLPLAVFGGSDDDAPMPAATGAAATE